jgi:drug/metabolite transporter (DMT)-like permease
MLCGICGQDNPLGSPRCFQCKGSLVPTQSEAKDNREKSVKPSGSNTIFGLVGVALSMVIFQAVAPHLFEPPTKSGINLVRVICAGIFGIAGMYAGQYFGKWLKSRQQK